MSKKEYIGKWKGRISKVASEHKDTFPKFLVVGISSTIVMLVTLYFFTEYLGIHYVISSLIAGEISIIWSFIWHDRWTWGKQNKQIPLLKRILAFEGIYITSLLANTALMFGFTNYLQIPYLISMVIAIGITFMFNYGMHSSVTFRKK